MLDMLDDRRVLDFGEFALGDKFPRDTLAFDQLAAFVVTRAVLPNLFAKLLGDFRCRLPAVLLVEKSHVIVDLNYSAFRSQVFHHLVRHVARCIADRAARGVRSKRRRLARFQDVVERLVTDVRNVHDHSEPVHFPNDILAEIRQPVVHGLVRRRIRPFIVAAVRKRHVANPQRRITPQHAEIRIDHVPALDSHQCGNLPLLAGFTNLCCCCGQH